MGMSLVHMCPRFVLTKGDRRIKRVGQRINPSKSEFNDICIRPTLQEKTLQGNHGEGCF